MASFSSQIISACCISSMFSELIKITLPLPIYEFVELFSIASGLSLGESSIVVLLTLIVVLVFRFGVNGEKILRVLENTVYYSLLGATFLLYFIVEGPYGTGFRESLNANELVVT